MPDTRATVAADLEATIAAHQPDDIGHCRPCPDRVRYPCQILLIAEDTADRLARRRQPKENHNVR